MTTLKTILLLFSCLYLGTTVAQPHYIWNEKVQNVYESISSLKIPEARKLNAIEKKNDPENFLINAIYIYKCYYKDDTNNIV